VLQGQEGGGVQEEHAALERSLSVDSSHQSCEVCVCVCVCVLVYVCVGESDCVLVSMCVCVLVLFSLRACAIDAE
jgi:hypothetical protein